ncbi:ABC transporter substrate-binding protein [Aliigemmobacter aestuarii]|uniref:ABC transporter substrate-binding protein n=1 Tax=Aliigemmobacter aestuarii TaxID=1445661 RepID=A0A4S3MUN2_9RHOB|nr:ABC transporter substrate-binding protein [Gemmobacter aestuarii]
MMVWASMATALEIEEEAILPGQPGGETLAILSTTDTAYFRPVLEAFQRANPELTIRYVVAGSQDVYAAVTERKMAFDVAISSAMDLQMKLANDGLALPHEPGAALPLPDWAQWQDRVFSIAQEPVVLVLSRPALDGLRLPQTRRDLVDLLRDHPDRFQGRVGTYDPRQSGAGYLFATQEARQSDSFWRLAEVMGAVDPLLYSSSVDMLDDLESGRLTIAHNVLGSYAADRVGDDSDLVAVEYQDFTLTLLRTALIPDNAPNPEAAGVFIDFLLSAEGRRLIGAEAGLPPVNEAALMQNPHLRPIRLDPGLLVYLDKMKRRAFLEEWSAAMFQP